MYVCRPCMLATVDPYIIKKGRWWGRKVALQSNFYPKPQKNVLGKHKKVQRKIKRLEEEQEQNYVIKLKVNGDLSCDMKTITKNGVTSKSILFARCM